MARPGRVPPWRRNRVNALIQDYLAGTRPGTFPDAFKMTRGLSGIAKVEAEAIWYFLRNHETKSIVEVGRRFGTGIFLMCCSSPNVERVVSIDNMIWPTDDPMKVWFKSNGIEADVATCNSREYVPDPSKTWDLVMIDGGHNVEVVTADLEMWRSRAKFLVFHDFADKGDQNYNNPKGVRNKRESYADMVSAIASARDRYGWEEVWPRGRSEIIFKVTKP